MKIALNKFYQLLKIVLINKRILGGKMYGEKPLISIIIPVYNVEKYLPRCLNSVINQTYENIEIIVVDDGSTDHSGQICDEYAEKDRRIEVIHKKNEGLSVARNEGIINASGKYLSFVDSDDYIALDYINYLFDLLIMAKADISICGYRKFYGNNVKHKEKKSKLIISNREKALFDLLYQREKLSPAWGKLFRKELFNHIKFPEGRIHEDIGIIYKIFFEASLIVYGNQEKYFYFQRENSISNKGFSEKKMDYVFFTKECMNFFSIRLSELYKAAVSRHFSACFELLCILYCRKTETILFEKNTAYLKQEIKKYRKLVLQDKNARTINRCAALFSYISIDFVVNVWNSLMKK